MRVDHMTAVYGLMFRKMWFHFSKGDFATYGKERYAQHYAEVRKLVPTENLLAYSVGAWEPLCTFLELPIPDTPFPSGNNQNGFWKFTRAWHKTRAMAAAKKASMWCLCIAVLLVAVHFGRP